MDLPALLPKVQTVAAEAARFIAGERRQFDLARVKNKGLNDLVSYVDTSSEKLIVDGLRDLLPGSGFIAEENTASNKGEYNWIIDPLDGTTNFIHGIPSYAVSIGLEHAGEVILGVVHEVSRSECFSAVKGGGAWLNNSTISVSQRQTLSEALVGTGFPVYNFSRMSQFLGAVEHFIRHTHGVRRIGAASVDLCYLACGRLDAFFEYNLQPWDVAAGALILKEAGGSVSDFSGKQDWLFGKEIACTNGLLKKEFEEVIGRHFVNGPS